MSAPRTTLLGTVGDDGLPVGSVLTLLWSQVAGPALATFATPSAIQTEVVFDTEGTYVFRLTASDTQSEASDTVTVEVLFVNVAPAVDAGSDTAVALPTNAVALEGAVVDDGLPLASPLKAAWRGVSGPAPVVFDDPAAPRTTARFIDPGTYVLRLRVSDGERVGQDEVTIVVQPTAAGGPGPAARLTGPVPGTRLTAPVDVTGTAQSPSLASWQLEHRLEGEDEWTRFASGTAEVTDGVLGRFDPTLSLNGIHQIRLTVTDTDARVIRTSTSVVVRDQMKVGHFTVSFVDLEVWE